MTFTFIPKEINFLIATDPDSVPGTFIIIFGLSIEFQRRIPSSIVNSELLANLGETSILIYPSLC